MPTGGGSEIRLRDELARAGALLRCLHPDIQPNMQTDLIFDVGAHNGNDTAYYLSRGFRVVAVEAHPLYCCALFQRFRQEIAGGRLHVLNFAVAEQAGLCALLESQKESQWTTIIPEVAADKSGDFREVMVAALTFDHVFARFGIPFFLKVDIEGSELSVLKHLVGRPEADRPQYVSFETGADVFMNLQILRDLGYARYKLVNQRVIHEKTIASSGPFGEDTPGAWVSREAIEEQVRAIRQPGAIRPDDWFDIHAGL
jgi:FkbM family methyltransferase